jgi:carbamoyl-phosphate synthase small subunit
MSVSVQTPSPSASAVLILADGSLYWGRGAGSKGIAVGEVCFNTSITGYQEILTDPSYAGQIITFTFPHIGNVGTNFEDVENKKPAVRGCVLRADITEPSNWRAVQHLNGWLVHQNLVAISGVDTRKLTRHIRDGGAPIGIIAHATDGKFDIGALTSKANDWPGLEGMDLAKTVTCNQSYIWDGQADWRLGRGYANKGDPKVHVVAVDFGAKLNILRCLAAAGCKVTIVPASASANDIMRYKPDGVFLSNGPGDPAATGAYALPMIKELLASSLPIFGICLGHQLLSLALGATTKKMHMGHRGANHPVKDLQTGQVEITSQNHGFVVERESLPDGVIETHRSLFDGTLEGICVKGKPIFSVQHHPEASPGPQDSHYLFKRFMDYILKAA